MWVLKSCLQNEERLIYVTLEKPKLSIGRNNTADVALEGDSSISRLHCTLHVAKNGNCPVKVNSKTGLWVVDCGSKYGTFIREPNRDFSKIETNEPKMLKNGSEIRFGVLENIWRIEYLPMIICTSAMEASEKNKLAIKIRNIGWDVAWEWTNECSYLLAGSLRLTAKILMALIRGVAIVKPEFIEEVFEAILRNEKFPDPKLFRPDLEETAVRVEDVNLEPGFHRLNLFNGKTFYVENEEHVKEFQTLIQAAGGEIYQISVANKKKLLENGAVLLDVSQANVTLSADSQEGLSQSVSEIREFVEKNGRRVIPSREVPLAIAYASVSRMCNAVRDDFPSGPIQAPEQPVSFSQYTLLEDESQPRETNKSPSLFVGNSLSQACESYTTQPTTSARKRGPSCDVFESPAPKKQLISTKCSQVNSFSSSQSSVNLGNLFSNLKRKADPSSESVKKIKSDVVGSSVEKITEPKPAIVEPGNWIDMAGRKDTEPPVMSNSLTDTIIMLSLVKLAQHLSDSVKDPRNVKVFTKQNVVDENRTVDLESQPELEEDWRRNGR